MYCANCGVKLYNNAKFCSNCGKEIASLSTLNTPGSEVEPLDQKQLALEKAPVSTDADVNYITKKSKVIVIVMTVVLAAVIFIGGLAFGIMSIIYNNPSYTTAINFIKHHPEIIELTGDIERFGKFSSGSINTSNGHGQAEFTIRVIGSDSTIRVHIRLEKEPLRDWEIVDYYYR